MRVRAGRFELLGKRVEKRSPPGDERDVIAALRVATSHRRPEPGPHAEDRDHALGITPREWAALSSLDDHPGLSQREMAELLGVDRTTMVALVDTLQSKGLVERGRQPDDRRKNVLGLTKEGRDLKERGGRLIDECEDRQLKNLLGAVIAP